MKGDGTAPGLEASGLRRLAARGSSLRERVNGSYVPAPADGDAARVEARAARWRRLAASGDSSAFASRLSAYGVQSDRAAVLLGTVRLPDEAPLPDWVSAVVALERAVAEARSRPSTAPSWLVAGSPVPFEPVLAPLVDCASETLHRRAGGRVGILGTAGLAALQRQLLVMVSGLASPCLYQEFAAHRGARLPGLALLLAGRAAETPTRVYSSFVDRMLGGGFASFLVEYAALARLLATAIDSWVETSAALLHRLDHDWHDLNETFGGAGGLGEVCALQASLSDRHLRGRTVAALHFSGGTCIVYKPRPVGLEAAWWRLARWAAAHGAPLPLSACLVLERDGYGWMAAADTAPCRDERDVVTYYERVGALLAVADALGASDLHGENVLACGDRPVPVDLETLLQPTVAAGQAHDSALGLLDVALLPLTLLRDQGVWLELGALGSVAPQSTGSRHARWEAINTDAMSLLREAGTLARSQAIPTIGGDPVAPWPHADAIVSGFVRMREWLAHHARALLSRDGPLDPAALGHARFLRRPTFTYASLLARSLEPDRLREGVDRSLEFEPLARRPGETAPPPAAFCTIVDAEQRSLERLDIPYFLVRADSDAVVLEDGTTVFGLFQASAAANAARRLHALEALVDRSRPPLIRATLEAARHRTAARGVEAAEVDGVTLDPDVADLGRRERLPGPGARLALGAGSVSIGPYVVGAVTDPATIEAALGLGINAFFVTADLHWPVYSATLEGLRRVLRARPSTRSDLVVLAATYVHHPGFTPGALVDLLASAPELEYLDVLVAGGCGLRRPLPLEIVTAARARFGPPGCLSNLGASFHHRTSALEAILARDLDAVFVRYNPAHPGARRDVFPFVANPPHHPLVFGFLASFGLDEEPRPAGEAAASPQPAGGWRPDRSDYYRFALTRPQIDGLLIAPAVPAHLDALIEAVRRGPLDPSEEARLMARARRPGATERDSG